MKLKPTSLNLMDFISKFHFKNNKQLDLNKYDSDPQIQAITSGIPLLPFYLMEKDKNFYLLNNLHIANILYKLVNGKLKTSKKNMDKLSKINITVYFIKNKLTDKQMEKFFYLSYLLNI